jgi:hypothetical protein
LTLGDSSTAYTKADWDWDDIPGVKPGREGGPFGFPRTQYINRTLKALEIVNARLPKIRREIQSIPHWKADDFNDKHEEYKIASLIKRNLLTFYHDAVQATQRRTQRKEIEDIIGVDSWSRFGANPYKDPSNVVPEPKKPKWQPLHSNPSW